MNTSRKSFAINDLKYRAHVRLSNERKLAPFYFRSRPKLHRLYPHVGHDILIDGFPRSANTYSVAAFSYSNPGSIISSHLHTPLSIMTAVRIGVPSLVLIREPIAAVSSLLTFKPGVSARTALRQYVHMYETLLPVRDEVVIGHFEIVTSHFGSLIEELNSRFGTDFNRYAKSAESEVAVLGIVEEMERHRAGGKLSEATVGRPSQERIRAAGMTARVVEQEKALLADARTIYSAWTQS